MRSMWAFVVAVAAVASGCAPVEDVVVDQVADPDVPVVGWQTPLDAELLGTPVSQDVLGASLQEIVSGQVEARGAGRTCTACHFGGTVTGYAPEVNQYATDTIDPYDVVHGRSWAGNNGWAATFVSLDENAFVEKPEELRTALQLWLDAEMDRVEPLGWNDEMTARNLGVEPDPAIAGDTLSDVVNSVVPGRPDDVICSVCHYEGGSIAYRPPVARASVSAFGPDDVVDGRAWAGPNGWAQVFAELGPTADGVHKPDYLRSMFFKWNDDGGY